MPLRYKEITVKYSKLFSILGIGGIVVLLLVFGFHLYAQNSVRSERIAANPSRMQQIEKFRNRQTAPNQKGQERSEDKDTNDSEAFYRAIIDNNIFRPLGWTPPRKEPEYALIGTAIYPNVAKAFVLERRSNQFYTAVVGDKVGEAVVKEIKQRQVTLDKAGEDITLRTGDMQFLNASGSRSSGRSSREESSRSDNNRSSSSSASRDAAMRKAKEAAEQKAKKEAEMKVMEMRRRFESASREQRERMIEEFRERGRRRRGRDR